MNVTVFGMIGSTLIMSTQVSFTSCISFLFFDDHRAFSWTNHINFSSVQKFHWCQPQLSTTGPLEESSISSFSLDHPQKMSSNSTLRWVWRIHILSNLITIVLWLSLPVFFFMKFYGIGIQVRDISHVMDEPSIKLCLRICVKESTYIASLSSAFSSTSRFIY